MCTCRPIDHAFDDDIDQYVVPGSQNSPLPPREPGWYLCAYADAPRAIRWDGTMWRWAESGMCVINQDKVDVLGTVTLEEGVEL